MFYIIHICTKKRTQNRIELGNERGDTMVNKKWKARRKNKGKKETSEKEKRNWEHFTFAKLKAIICSVSVNTKRFFFCNEKDIGSFFLMKAILLWCCWVVRLPPSTRNWNWLVYIFPFDNVYGQRKRIYVDSSGREFLVMTTMSTTEHDDCHGVSFLQLPVRSGKMKASQTQSVFLRLSCLYTSHFSSSFLG